MSPVQVGVVMGSSSDWETLQHAVAVRTEFGIAHGERIACVITEAAAARLAVPTGGAWEPTETYEHDAPIAARIYALR